MDKPQMIVVGGPNGSGKTTFAHEALIKYDVEYIGADAIATELMPTKPESVAIEAGREFIIRLTNRIENRQSVVVESTLAGRSLIRYIEKASAAGFSTAINFVYLDSEDASVSRVAQRVRRGGHHVPEADVRRRYRRSVQNFWYDYRFAVDSWMIYDNSGENYLEVACGKADNYAVFHQDSMSYFLSEAEAGNI